MFNFFSSIKKECFKNHDITSDYRFQNDSGKQIYFEGVKKVLNVDSETITFSTKKRLINICGKNMVVVELSIGTIAIEGVIEKIEVVQ